MEDEKEQVSQIIHGCCYLMTQNLWFHRKFFLRLLIQRIWSRNLLVVRRVFFFLSFFQLEIILGHCYKQG